MPNEIEAKFKVENFRAIRSRLAEIGAVYLGTNLQTDTYYDTPGGSLLGEDKGLRIRNTRVLRTAPGAEKCDTRPLLTYKGPADDHQKAKIRREIQTCIDSQDAMNEILIALGLTPTLTIQKKRAGYRLGKCLIELDELPLIGRFVEIEAPNPKRIETVRRKLIIEAEPCREHYITLLSEACERISQSCLEVTFDNCTDCNLI